MHTVHQIVAIGSSVDEALNDIELKLNSFPEGSSWFDWYQIGGRWDGIVIEEFPELKNKLENPNVLPVFGNETIVESILGEIDIRQNNRFLETKDVFLGNEVFSVEEAQGHILGVPVVDTDEQARRVTKYNKDGFEEWKEILASNSLHELHENYSFIAGYNLDILNNFLTGKWFNETGYYDFFNHSSKTKYLKEMLSGDSSRKSCYLVTIDFHY